MARMPTMGMETGRVEIGGMVVDVVEFFRSANTVERGGYGGGTRSSNVWLTNAIDPVSHLVDFWSETSPAPPDENLPRVDTRWVLISPRILGSNPAQASSPLTHMMESCDTRSLTTYRERQYSDLLLPVYKLRQHPSGLAIGTLEVTGHSTRTSSYVRGGCTQGLFSVSMLRSFSLPMPTAVADSLGDVISVLLRS